MNKDLLIVHFDGLIGPTHHYAGLSSGNLASMTHQKQISHPKAAALQGLEKMRLMQNLGVKQAFLPPPLRPRLDIVRKLGFYGVESQLIEQVAKADPQLLSQVYSASSMWAANSATASPSNHCQDGRVHITSANLITMFHRHLEAQESDAILKKIFHDERFFSVHAPLPSHLQFADEGSANHLNLEELELFVFGSPHAIYPARQTQAASKAIDRLHQVKKAFFIEQNPEAINAGVFHNDVIAFCDDALIVMHEKAYMNQQEVIKQIQTASKAQIVVVLEKEIDIKTAVSTYFFNSHSIHLNGKRILVAPKECENNKMVYDYLKTLPYDALHFVNLEQSMKNGGGPGCLTLSIPMTQDEWEAVHEGVKLTKERYHLLKNHIHTHYRETLSIEELQDPLLIEEARRAHEALALIWE